MKYELTGSIVNGAYLNFDALGHPIVSIKLNEKQSALQMVDELKECDKLYFNISKHKKKRSNDANGYYWLLLNKLSKKLKISLPYCHNIMLRRYGTLEEFDGKPVLIIIQDTEEASRKADETETYHIKPTSQVKEGSDGLMYRTYLLLKGSHEYNTAEFSNLISGLIDECRQVGIATATPNEVANLLSLMNGGKQA